MDFDLLDLRQTADKEYWIQLRLGSTSLFADMEKQERPCKIKVASVSNPEVEALVKSVSRIGQRYGRAEMEYSSANREQRVGLEKRLDSIDKEAERLFGEFIIRVVLDWENIDKGGKPLKFSDDVLKDMSVKGAPLYRMVKEIAEDSAKAQNPFTGAESD